LFLNRRKLIYFLGEEKNVTNSSSPTQEWANFSYKTSGRHRMAVVNSFTLQFVLLCAIRWKHNAGHFTTILWGILTLQLRKETENTYVTLRYIRYVVSMLCLQVTSSNC